VTAEVLDDLGHFPMVEDPDRLRPHLVRALERVRAGAAGRSTHNERSER
jgi:hypothetical protein